METFSIDRNQQLVKINSRWVNHINGVPDSENPDYLFKYYSLNFNNLDALNQGYFYLNNPKEFNDPFDCSYNLIKDYRNQSLKGSREYLENNVANKGICCFSMNGMNPLMWGHYTNSFFGYVIKFKAKKFELSKNDSFGDIKILKVIYSENPEPIDLNHPIANQYQLTIKKLDWKYEREYRIIAEKKVDFAKKLLFPRDIVEEVQFGYRLWDAVPLRLPEICAQRDKLIEILDVHYPEAKRSVISPCLSEFRLERSEL